MLVSAAVCPHPPALVPAVSQGAHGLLADLRAAAFAAVGELRDGDLDLLLCVGGGEAGADWGPDGGGSLRGYGVGASFGGAESGMPLSLTVADYLAESTGTSVDGFVSVAAAATPEDCAARGADLAGSAPRVGLLVMADGSARHTRQSPGPFDERAVAYDAAVLTALTAPDPDALLALDPELSTELWVGGRPAWQVLAGALLASPGRWVGVTRYAQAPLGVGYAVVRLDRESDP
jgi:hypothetical protein